MARTKLIRGRPDIIQTLSQTPTSITLDVLISSMKIKSAALCDINEATLLS